MQSQISPLSADVISFLYGYIFIIWHHTTGMFQLWLESLWCQLYML